MENTTNYFKLSYLNKNNNFIKFFTLTINLFNILKKKKIFLIRLFLKKNENILKKINILKKYQLYDNLIENLKNAYNTKNITKIFIIKPI